MKNLFKKMMLVAVAAMAFVACSQDNDEINATVKKTDVVFNLSIEDVTRAYFGEEQGSGSDTSFPSYWSGNESVTLVAYDADDVVVSTAYGSIEAEGEQATQARVAATFDGDLAGVAKVRAYVGSWSYDEPRVPEVGQEQYMEKEGTVASNAHTMSAEAAWDGVAQSIDLNFSHAVAYGRMQIKDLNDVTITKAIVKVDEAEYQVSLSSELDTKYIWFACDADDAIATLDIEVKASNGRSYVKTINMAEKANPLKFLTGQVSKFAVSGLTEKPADYTLDLNKVVARTGNTITFQGDDEKDTWTVYFNPGLTEIVEGVYQGAYNASYNESWTSESALEFDSLESSFNLAVNPAPYAYYLLNGNGATINVSVEDGIYTITALWTVSIGGSAKTVQISYVGDLTVETPVVPEPEGLVFTSAAWVNTSYSDKLVQFYTADGATLQLNWYNCGSDNWIVPNTYGFASSGAIYWGGQFSWYENAAAGIDTEIVDGTVTVSIVDGKYYIEFKNLADYDKVQIESATFTGEIAGLIVPDMREKLAKPTNVQVSVSGKTITTTWEAVEGAEGYLFELYNPVDEAFTQIVEGTSFSFTGLNSNWNYYFKLTAYASDENPSYRSSDEIYLEKRTEDTDPKMEISESKLSFTADGGEKTFTVTLKNTDAAIEYTQVGDWFTVAFSGDTFTVNASANESETDAREGSITVTAGELSQKIDVTQSKKSAVSTGGADGKTLETAYKFTTYTKKIDFGYPVMCLSGSEDNAVFEFESNGSGSYPQGLLKFTHSSWYNNWIVYHVNGEIVHDTVGDTRVSSIDLDKSYTYLTKSGNEYTVEYIKIVLYSGEEIWYTFDGTFTF